MKRCAHCAEEKPESEFYKNSRNKDGLQGYCKTCSKEKVRVFNQSKREELIASDGNHCSICREAPVVPGPVLAIDHCHASGKIRGLLCRDCNLGLGHFKDRPDLLRAAAAYLLR